ncbi:c-type cytochrome [Flavihumibacter stibioxidans]|uniref:Cytochrome c domain-containing protein n=1 Tax=Flavihumibacter stibioxidans TaxID=1834163 RepID=A0ABR7MAU4_9BACT|nr:cytochrome c [Flavihumibacter stibioxidans]MBC6492136.1 hypothetical protein [Flavihumibacter stibioxidans]
MTKKNILALVTLVSITWISCYYDKEELLYPGSTACDTLTAISYTKNIAPLFQQYCNSCHGGNSPSGGISMGNYTADKAIALNGKLYGSISHSNGYSPMPQGMPKMNTCQIATIKKWVDSGAPNN